MEKCGRSTTDTTYILDQQFTVGVELNRRAPFRCVARLVLLLLRFCQRTQDLVSNQYTLSIITKNDRRVQRINYIF